MSWSLERTGVNGSCCWQERSPREGGKSQRSLLRPADVEGVHALALGPGKECVPGLLEFSVHPCLLDCDLYVGSNQSCQGIQILFPSRLTWIACLILDSK